MDGDGTGDEDPNDDRLCASCVNICASDSRGGNLSRGRITEIVARPTLDSDRSAGPPRRLRLSNSLQQHVAKRFLGTDSHDSYFSNTKRQR
ncbi:hypothetical protein PRBEI_2000841500 [Prionailurus iriomotensis]